MKTIEEVLEYIAENDVKFVKLSFCDLLGRQKNVSLNASRFLAACEEGVAVDSSALGMGGGEDLLLFPDIGTVTAMPWRPSSGAVINVVCRVRYCDGRPFEGDCSVILEKTAAHFAEMGYSASFMTESEFYITRVGDDGEPTLSPVDRAGYLDAAPLDRCENLRREIVFTLESMGMKPLSSHHEHGWGQNAVIFQSNTAYKSAVNTLLFRNAVRNIAYANGVYATFAPSPLENSIGSNFRVVIELNSCGGKKADAGEAKAFAEGLLARLPEIAVFTNPIRNSYRRLIHRDTPSRLTLGGPKSAVRINEHSRKIEFVSADTACNPFVVLSLVLRAGAEGLAGNAPAPIPGARLPASLSEAVEAAKDSDFLKENLPSVFLGAYLERKEREAGELSRDDVLRDGL